MNIAEILLIAVGLSMDAFAVSICKGLSMDGPNIRANICAGLYFGIFQALMPLAGYFAGAAFSRIVDNVDHWIAFALLTFIGAKMIWERHREGREDASFAPRVMLIAAVATSIDALAVGVSFAFLDVNICLAIAIIGVTTFIFAAAGIKIGQLFGVKYKAGAQLVGGLVLIGIGIKILAEGLFT